MSRVKKKIIQKNKVFDGLLWWRLQDPEDENKQEFVRRFNDVIIAREFKYTHQEIMDLPQYFYDDCILIISKKNAMEKAERERNNTPVRHK